MSQQTKEVIVAIDFGTTFSGVAWTRVSHPDAQYIIDQWPYDTISKVTCGMTSEKVPSELAYKYKKDSIIMPIWGFQIPERMPRLQFLKLDLEPEPKVVPRSMRRNNMPLESHDTRRMVYPDHATAESAIVDYLRALLNHSTKMIKDKVGAAFASMTFTYVITVPAIWSDKAKRTTLKCAEKAGMTASQIISEPEAAAIHTLKASSPHSINVGDTIIVCDAGGGTVDLITFTILELEPSLRLKEEAPGNGALCGGTYLNRQFEEFLRDKLESCDGWGNDTMDRAMEKFERTVKRQFAGVLDDTFTFPVPGIADSKSLGVRRGYLHVSGDEIYKLCLPVLERVNDLVKKQMDISKRSVTALFLVGGFGDSPLLRVHLEKNAASSIDLITPVNGWTAVVRGALTKAVATISSSAPQIAVDSRVARRSYGNIISVKFDSSIHEGGRKYWSDFHGEDRIEVMDWIIRKGDDILESKPIVIRRKKRKLKKQGKFTDVKHLIYEMDTPDGVNEPMYFDRKAMEQHTVLHPELDRILRENIPLVRGADDRQYYKLDYKVHATYYSAHCEYSLWFAGKNHGAVRVDYV